MKDNQVFCLNFDFLPMEYSSLISCQIWEPSNILALIFFNWQASYLKQLLSVGNTKTNCFMRPNFIDSRGNMIFFVNKWFMLTVGIISFEVRSWSLVPLYLMVLSGFSVSYAQKGGILILSLMRTKKEAYHFKVNIVCDNSINLYVFIFFIKTNWMPKWDYTI